jgi:MFS family permease
VSATAQSVRLSTFAALKGRNYSLYWFGLVFYVLGHRAEYTTFAWLTWEVSRSPLSLAYLGLAQGVPLVLFQLCGGVLADRINRLRLLVATQTLISLVLGTAFVLTVLGLARLPILLVLAALSNVFRAFDEPSRMALVPQLVERERLPNAIALGSIPWQAGRMIGPSVTGILIATLGGAVGFGMATAASCLALVLYSRLRIHVPRRASDGRHVLQQFVEGLSFVGHNFVFACLIALALFNSLFAMSYLTLLPIYADAYFNTGSTGFGLLNAAHGVGALVGTLTVATIAHLLRRGRAVLLGAASVGVALMLFSRTPALGLALLVLVTVGFCNTFYLTQVSTYLQQNVPDHLRGRVMSLYSLCWNLLPLGGLLAGALAAAVDARFAVLFGGMMVTANALVLMGSRRLRTIT